MQVTLLHSSDYQRTPWKNGLGFTDQIAIEPKDADLRRGDFLWRLSSARIERAAPFSLFPNHDRVLVVLEGSGVTLTHTYDEGAEPELVELPPLQPYEFPGDVPTRCDLKSGPIQDLSVFFAKGRAAVQAELAAIEAGGVFSWEPQGAIHFVFVQQGEITLQGKRAAAGETLKLDLGREPLEASLELQAGAEGAQAILIQIEQ